MLPIGAFFGTGSLRPPPLLYILQTNFTFLSSLLLSICESRLHFNPIYFMPHNLLDISVRMRKLHLKAHTGEFVCVVILHYVTAGTDDDLPPSHPNRFPRAGSAAGNVRSEVFGTAQFLPMDMEIKIHHIEQEAYISVLRAFKAQSEAITWVQLYSENMMSSVSKRVGFVLIVLHFCVF